MFHKFKFKLAGSDYEYKIYYVNQHVVDKYPTLYTDAVEPFMVRKRADCADYIVERGQLTKARLHSIENMLDKVLEIK